MSSEQMIKLLKENLETAENTIEYLQHAVTKKNEELRYAGRVLNDVICFGNIADGELLDFVIAAEHRAITESNR